MGLCGGKEDSRDPTADKASKDIDNAIIDSHEKDVKIIKLLLLGAGESGKSTLFKALISLYGKGYPEEERKSFTKVIWNNTIAAMKELVQHSKKYGGIQSEGGQEAASFFEEAGRWDDELDEKMGTHISNLWSDEGIQKTYANRANFQLFDSAKYFFDRIDKICKQGYIPDTQDVLRCRVRTTGIVVTNFQIDGNEFQMVDVGGQRNERKKWIHCFEGVTAVIFVAAISEYDQTCFEDEATNRMDETLKLFDEICNSKYFKQTAMILFLNKRDLFEDKIKVVPLSVWQPDCEAATYEQGVEYMQDQFEGKSEDSNKPLYVHVTCATDTDNISNVFEAVKDIIIRKALNDAGLG